MNGKWKEANEHTVPLPEDDPEIFSLYLKLLYVSFQSLIPQELDVLTDRTQTEKIPVKDISPDPTNPDTVADEYTSLSKLFVLSKKLMDDMAKEVVLAAMLARAKEPFSDGQLYYPALDCVQIIYEGTPEQSPARQLLVQLYTDFGNVDFITEKAEVIPKDFLYDLSLSTLRNRVTLEKHNKALTERDLSKEESARNLHEMLDTKDQYATIFQTLAVLRVENEKLRNETKKPRKDTQRNTDFDWSSD